MMVAARSPRATTASRGWCRRHRLWALGSGPRLTETLLRAQRGQHQDDAAPGEQGERLRPERLEPHTLQKDASQNDEEIPKRDEIGDRLDRPGHVLDRKDEAGQEHHR